MTQFVQNPVTNFGERTLGTRLCGSKFRVLLTELILERKYVIDYEQSLFPSFVRRANEKIACVAGVQRVAG